MFFQRDAFRFPEQFSNALSSAIWGNNEPDPKDVLRRGEKLRQLWPKLAENLGEKSESESHYSELRDLVGAYGAYYLAANAPKIPLILEEAHLLGLDIVKDGSRWLDFGSGPGTTLWGLSWWAKAHSRQFQFLGLEQSKAFLDTASSYSQFLRAYHPQHQANFSRFQGKNGKAIVEAVEKNQSDIISFVNSFHEFFPSVTEKQNAGKTLFEALQSKFRRDGKTRWVLIVEPASRINSRQLGECLRFWQDQKLAQLWLPCFGARTCGALASPKDWCHEAADCEFPSWLQTLGRSAGLKKESVLFSYALLSVGEKRPEWPVDTYRMVSQRLEQKGQTECYFCSSNGKLRCRVQHSKTTPETEFFHQISRGDLFRELEAGERGDIQRLTPLLDSASANPDLFPPAL